MPHLRQTGSLHFNGMHLLVEADATGWFQEYGGIAKGWDMYRNAAAVAGFTTSLPLVVASGIFSGNVTADERVQLAKLKDAAASAIVEKSPHLSASCMTIGG